MQPYTFKYIFGNGDRSTTYFDTLGNIKFYPPVYLQRYHSTISILTDNIWSQQIKKVVDFGCSEMKFLFTLRRVPTIEHLMEVDTDEEVLRKFSHRAVPIVSDYMNPRQHPLHIDVLQGSIDEPVECLKNTDAVIALEVIEHLDPAVFERVPANIFGFIQPKLAIFTTPNADFNVLFNGMLQNGFRHPDHKFEWSREEFRNWALKICENYPNYSVFITGIGKPPPEHKHVGRVTQLALFARNDMINRPLRQPLTDMAPDPEKIYKTIYSIDFPHYDDGRTREQKIVDEIAYHTSRLTSMPDFYNNERKVFQLPVSMIHNFTAPYDCSMLELLAILQQQNYCIENDAIIVIPEYTENLSEECSTGDTIGGDGADGDDGGGGAAAAVGGGGLDGGAVGGGAVYDGNIVGNEAAEASWD